MIVNFRKEIYFLSKFVFPQKVMTTVLFCAMTINKQIVSMCSLKYYVDHPKCMAEEVEDTFDKLKAGAKAVAKKVTDPSSDIGAEYEKEKGNEKADDYEQVGRSGGKEPMSPEKIESHEPTAVKRDKNQPSTGEPV
jgi:hypothetical protein